MDYQFWVPILISVTSSITLAIWNIRQQTRFEHLKTEFEKQLFNHRIQFEKEFAVYDELWTRLVELQKSIEMLQPLMDYVPPGKTYDETIKERVAAIVDLSNDTMEIFLKRKPFYSSSVFERIEPLLRLVRREVLEIGHGTRFDPEYWKRRRATVEEFVRLLDPICDTIRERINRD